MISVTDIAGAIREADAHGLATDRGADVLTGLSGHRLVGALQRFAQLFDGEPDACYAEIGVFQGLTLLSVAAAAPGLPCYGIDNFSLLNPDGENLGIVEQRRTAIGVDNAHILDRDFEDALENFGALTRGKRIAVLFIDGSHDYRSQLVSLLFAMEYLHERAVIVIDDANYRHVRQANRDFLAAQPDYRLIYEGYSAGHPDNLTPEQLDAARNGWWNGVNILVRDPEGALPREFPPVADDKTPYFNEHYVHRYGVAEIAPEAMAVAQALADGADGAAADIAGLTEKARAFRAAHADRHSDKNTYSAELTPGRFVEPRG